MEKVMSVEEKIRRAEEIYNRRNGNIYVKYKSEERKRPSLTKKMIKQIIICCMVYGIFYVVENREYYLSQEFQTKVQNVASQNEILNNTYNYIVGYIEKYYPQSDKTEENLNEEENMQIQEETTSKENLEENIGGADESEVNEDKSQEEKDIEEIKSITSFINPIEGRISSTFGWRTPTTSTVPKYHTGLDIAATTGTVIKSATNGTVILASSEGDYGKHYKIQIDDIIIVYAHCSKLYLKEGDEVYQGQEIAEVGSTGNSTRTTFTF